MPTLVLVRLGTDIILINWHLMKRHHRSGLWLLLLLEVDLWLMLNSLNLVFLHCEPLNIGLNVVETRIHSKTNTHQNFPWFLDKLTHCAIDCWYWSKSIFSMSGVRRVSMNGCPSWSSHFRSTSVEISYKYNNFRRVLAVSGKGGAN